MITGMAQNLLLFVFIWKKEKKTKETKVPKNTKAMALKKVAKLSLETKEIRQKNTETAKTFLTFYLMVFDESLLWWTILQLEFNIAVHILPSISRSKANQQWNLVS